ncbi:MAG: dihydropteroate synthase [Syntrophomonadaceae bacterium]|nr:dihydropteroate synthase [Syntrophomonadaceae bacterium]
MRCGWVRAVKVRDERDAAQLISRVGADQPGVEIMAPKAVFQVLQVRGLSAPAALILKQEMLARGGEAAIDRRAVLGEAGSGEAVLMGTRRQYRQLAAKLEQQPFGLKLLAGEIRRIIERESEGSPGLFGLPLGERTLVMGILNLTPDSFSDGGRYNRPEESLKRAEEMIAEGADLIDVGGESTRPGAVAVSEEEEWRRVFPLLERLLPQTATPLSIDTYKASIARRALGMGVRLINDVGGLKADPDMARVIADHDAAVVIMHNRAAAEYCDLMADICQDLGESLEIAERAGIDPRRIILDPGIGFGKTAEHNLEVLRRLEELRSLGKPLLVGTSRKSFIGRVLDKPPGERLEGTAATVALSIAAGADIVRVHDVREMAAVARMADAVVRRG